MKTTDQTMTMDDGQPIRVLRHEPEAGAPTGVIQFVHGFGEHVRMYDRLAEFCTEQGYAFVIHDQRGHGELAQLTPEQRAKALGVVPSYALFLSDITAVRARIDSWFPDAPAHLWGLSMGGGIAANYVERVPQPRYDKVILESPWLRLAQPKPGVVTAVARVVGRLHPSMAIDAGLDLDAVTRDQHENQTLRDDPFYHGRISLRLYAQIVAAGEYAIAHAGDITRPTLLLTGSGDRIVSVEAIREFAAKAGPSLSLRQFDGAYHCLHYDTNSAEVRAVIMDFLG